MKRGVNLVGAAFALTALSYGLARFAYGLLLPQIRKDLALDVSTAGWIGGSAFAAYCVGILFAFVSSGALSPRALALMAGLSATLGMGLVVCASSALPLGLGIALAGLSTGLTSPPLASAVSAQFSADARPKANAVINAGTGAGIVLSGLAALVAAGAWRELYALFALVGAGISVWLWFAISPRRHSEAEGVFSFSRLRRPGLLALCCSAFLMGLASTAVWTFGADILRSEAGFSPAYIAAAWIVLGSAGLGGACTGTLTQRVGTGNLLTAALVGIAMATLGLATVAHAPLGGFAAMGVFGATYIVATSGYLIKGIALLPDRPDLGIGLPFLVLALGQTVGTPLFGALLEATGVVSALATFALAACLAIVVQPRGRAVHSSASG